MIKIIYECLSINVDLWWLYGVISIWGRRIWSALMKHCSVSFFPVIVLMSPMSLASSAANIRSLFKSQNSLLAAREFEYLNSSFSLSWNRALWPLPSVTCTVTLARFLGQPGVCCAFGLLGFSEGDVRGHLELLPRFPLGAASAAVCPSVGLIL